jgi:hypothetical protein
MREDVPPIVTLDQDHHLSEVSELIASVIRGQHQRFDTFLAPGFQERMDAWRAEIEPSDDQ